MTEDGQYVLKVEMLSLSRKNLAERQRYLPFDD